MSVRHFAFVGIICTAMSGLAQQTYVMSFQSFELPGTGLSFVGKSIEESGMILTTLSAEGMANEFTAWKTNDSYYRGSMAIANSHGYGTTVLSRTNGAPFDFLGIDLTGFQPYHAGTVTFYGFRGFECRASESFTFPGGRFRTFKTCRLTNVTEIRWDNNPSAVPQFDNVTVSFDANLPMAQPIIRIRRGDAVALDIAGLMVNAPYALEYSTDSAHWIRERTFSSSSTINFPGFISPAVPANRFYRVRGL